MTKIDESSYKLWLSQYSYGPLAWHRVDESFFNSTLTLKNLTLEVSGTFRCSMTRRREYTKEHVKMNNITVLYDLYEVFPAVNTTIAVFGNHMF